MTVSVKVIKDSFVRPTKPPPDPAPRLELSGVDVLFNRMNLRVAYFFPAPLSAHALKASLAQVLGMCVCVFGGGGGRPVDGMGGWSQSGAEMHGHVRGVLPHPLRRGRDSSLSFLIIHTDPIHP